MRREDLRRNLMGEYFDRDDPESIEGFLTQLLQKIFRRPPSSEEVESYVNLVSVEQRKTGDLHQGFHLAVRTALVSPAFLYREIPNTPTDQILINRLSYFLTSRSPSNDMIRELGEDDLCDSKTLRRVAKRLIQKQSKPFVADFTNQWLGTWKVDQLMPDARLVERFDSKNRGPMRGEVTATFEYILKNNLPITDFIAPDFLFTDPIVGWEIYRIAEFKPKKARSRAAPGKGIRKVSIDRDGHLGGLLGMGAVMMSTANGVDTQPVLRGVWVLENILGSPPPEPPDAVPALTPDTSAATSIREKLKAHQSDVNCASCHREIDPLGFVLESFDAIGRWRDHYPVYQQDEDGQSKTRKGARIDSSGTLTDGTQIKDVRDLKAWLVANPKPWACCLSEKLLTYATGRELSFRERSIVSGIVDRLYESNSKVGFQDLLLELVDSEVFRTP